MKSLPIFCSAVFFVYGLVPAQQVATQTKLPDLVVIHGSVVSCDASEIAHDGPVILKVRSEENDALWEVSLNPWCGSYAGSTSEKVTIRGVMISSGKLNVCGDGTYIKIHKYSEPEVDSIIIFRGTVQYYDPTPTYVDGTGILIVRTSRDELWDISFGGMRFPGCTAPFPYKELDDGGIDVVVAGKMMNNGTLDVCDEGTYVTFGTSVTDRHTGFPPAIEKSSPVQRGRSQGNSYTLDGRMVTTGSPDASDIRKDAPAKSLSLKRNRVSKQIIVHR